MTTEKEQRRKEGNWNWKATVLQCKQQGQSYSATWVHDKKENTHSKAEGDLNFCLRAISVNEEKPLVKSNREQRAEEIFIISSDNRT